MKKKNIYWFRISVLVAMLVTIMQSYATTYTSTVVTGNWSSSTSWSPAGVPGSTDNVVIHGGDIITVDSIFTCNNLTIGDATVGNAYAQITTAGNALTINGALSINPNSVNKTYYLDAGPGNINIMGTFPTWCTTTGANTVRVSTGVVTFVPAVTVSAASQNIVFYGAGIINFNSSYTDQYNRMVTFAGCTVNFGGSYNVNTTTANWAGKGTAVFTGNSTITAVSNLILYNVQFASGSSVALAASTGAVSIAGTTTLATGSHFTTNENFEIDGSWTNNGTFTGGLNTICMNGVISVTGATVFPYIQLGNLTTTITVTVTLNANVTCSGITYTSYNRGRSFAIGAGDTLTVNGNVLVNQPASASTNTLAVNTGTCNINGNLTFSGTTATASYISSATVTSGTLNIAGNVTYDANTLAADQVISVSTGVINFTKSLTVAYGTLSVSGTGIINFNGTTAPSLNFGGSGTPVFTTASTSNLNFAKGLTNNTNTLTFTTGGKVTFTGSAAITPNASILFPHLTFSTSGTDTIAAGTGVVTVKGNLLIPSLCVLIANQGFEVDGNWTNNGGTLNATPGTTITLNGSASSINGSTSTIFPILQIGLAATVATESMTMTVSNSCAGLIFSSATKTRTLTLSTGTTLTINGALTINQPAAIGTNYLAINTATCNVKGDLTFVGTTNISTWVSKVGVTTGSLSVSGAVNWMNDTLVATEVVTVSTGSISFGSSLSMGKGSGTLSVTSTGTINFNGITSPSFTFGGAAISPVFTTTSGCHLNFVNGFTNNTNALVLAATSISVFTANGAITPNANITFGNMQLNASDTINSATGSAIVASVFTLSVKSTIVNNQAFEVRGNWVNNGGIVISGVNAIVLNGTAQTIGGTSSTAFQALQIGGSSIASTVICTMNINTTCSSLVFHPSTTARTLALTTGDTLMVTGDVTINQPTAASRTNALSVNGGTCTVTGNLVFSGTTNTTTYISRVTITTGSFTLNGNVTWMSNTAVATEVISVTTGTLTFANSLTMGSNSGTINVTGAATVNFNGATAPSLNFGGVATVPSFTTVANCILNFKNGLTNNTNALTFANGSTCMFTGKGTVTPSAAITFGNLQINATDSLTLAGNISVTNNWTDNGVLIPGTNTVTFNGTSTSTQTVAKPGGETFYKLSATTVGATLLLANNLNIANTLTMSGHNINLNNDTLILGSGAAATLTRTAGIAYGGVWKRWLPVAAITGTSGSFYGLFPVGTSTAYRPLSIASTVNPTTAGYVLASHTDGTGITLVTYTDNESATVQVISNMQSALATSGLAGGTYTLTASYTGLATTGVITDEKLETYTVNIMGSAGTTVATTGTVASPNAIRSGLSTTQLNNVWVVGSKNKTNTPLRPYYYSRKTGVWNDTTVGNSTWSYIPGGAGASCNCVPSSAAYTIVSTGDTVTLNVTSSVDYLDVNAGGRLTDNGVAALTINRDLTLYGAGIFVNNSVWTVAGNINLSTSSSPTSSGTINSAGILSIPVGTTYSQLSGTLSITGTAKILGTLALGSSTLTISGGATSFNGSGNITTTGSSTINMTGNCAISSGANLSIGSSASPITFAISGATTLTNNGRVKINGNLTGSAAGSTWTNNANASLEITGALLATGTLNASASPDTVKYSGNGSQTIKAPASSYYNLVVANGGTKSLGASIATTNSVIIQDSAVLDMSTYALTGNADLYMTGTSELKLQRSTAGYYPEINGNYHLTGGTVTINQTTGTATVNNGEYYNLKFTGAQPYDISGISNIDGSFYIQGSSTLINSIPLTVAGTFNYSSSGSTTLNDDLTTSNFTISAGTLNDGGNVITVNGSGGWNNNGGIYTTTGEVDFTAIAAQQIGGSKPTAFNALGINNTSGVTLNVNPAAPTIISGSLSLIAGKLFTTSQNILRILNNATSNSGSATSYVEGPMVKVGNDNFIFPIGKNGNWRKAGILNITDSLSEVKAEYFSIPYDTLNQVASPLYEVSGQEYWTVERTVSSDSLKLQLYWGNISQLKGWDCSNLSIAHWKNSHWVEEPATEVDGSNCTYGGTGSMLTTGYVTSFSPFTFGGENTAALPIELLSFNAAPVETTISTTWATAIEINNDYFTVERSVDGINFTQQAKVKGAGNSTTQKDYTWIDETPLPGISYYRLKQTDFNGNYTYSNIVGVNFTSSGSITMYPNPARSQVYLNIANPATNLECEIYDMQGRRVLRKSLPSENGVAQQIFAVPLEGNLPTGIYFVLVKNETQEYLKQKLVIQQ